MEKNKLIRNILYVVLFAAVFFLIQFIVEYAGAAIYAISNGASVKDALIGLASGQYSKLLTAIVVLYSLVTIALFVGLKWSPVSRTYLKSKPWGVIFWVVCLALGTILPLEWIYEKVQLTMPEQTEQLFEGVMKEPWGYAAIGLLVPVAEELVFRGGILRKLLQIFSINDEGKTTNAGHWCAIAISALIFGAMHLNAAQGVHAFLIGLLLGWMYYRTRSIIPSIAFHWVNNSVAYIMYNVMPQMNDGKLIDLFHGSNKMMYMGLAFSLCILIPSIFQLATRLKPAK